MSVHLVQEVLLVAAGVVLLIVAVAMAWLIVTNLILDRGRGLSRRNAARRQGRENRPS